MQVFVPFPNIFESLDILDKKRLVKQVIECGQILDVILQRKTGKGWINHPAVKMWENNPDALKHYKDQGFYLAFNKFNVHWVKTKPETLPDDSLPKMPDWWGRPDIHESHLSNLKRKAIDSSNKTSELYYNMIDKLGRKTFDQINPYLPYVWS